MMHHHNVKNMSLSLKSSFLLKSWNGGVRWTWRSSSETVLPNTSDITNKNPSLIHNKPCSPRPLFPWRHSSTVLPRLNPTSVEYFTQGGPLGPGIPTLNAFANNILWLTSCRALQVSYWDIFISKRWEREISHSFVMAFQQALQGLLVNTFHAPIDMIIPTSNNLDDESLRDFPIYLDHLIESSKHQDFSSTPHMEIEPNLLVDDMLENNLHTLYKSCHQHSNKHRLQIKLFCKPMSATLVSLNLVPFLTRKEVEMTPSLRSSFTDVYHSLEKMEHESLTMSGKKLSFFAIMSHIFSALETMGLRQLKDTCSCIKCTVVAQVLISCREIFHVKDLGLDATIQGDSDEKLRDAVHLVRFEMVVSIDAETGESSIGHWIITDWDDLLGGNLFFK